MDTKKRPLTSTERVQQMRERDKADGFARLDLRVHPGDVVKLKAFAAKLAAARVK